LVFFVAEIGSNWEGDVKKAKSLIAHCKLANISAVKFQMWRQKDLYPNEPSFKKFELTFHKAIQIWQYCNDIHFPFFCSPFYPEAVEFLDRVLQVKWFKIASRTARMEDPFAKETIKAIARTKKPVMVSMGMGGMKRIIERILEPNKVSWMYCVSKYPTEEREINWKEAEKHDGFSDHTIGLESCVRFIQRKGENCIIEKHVMLPHTISPDVVCSITVQDLAYLMTVLTSSSDIPG